MTKVVTSSLPGQTIDLWCMEGSVKSVTAPEDSGQLVYRLIYDSLNNATHPLYFCAAFVVDTENRQKVEKFNAHPFSDLVKNCGQYTCHFWWSISRN